MYSGAIFRLTPPMGVRYVLAILFTFAAGSGCTTSSWNAVGTDRRTDDNIVVGNEFQMVVVDKPALTKPSVELQTVRYSLFPEVEITKYAESERYSAFNTGLLVGCIGAAGLAIGIAAQEGQLGAISLLVMVLGPAFVAQFSPSYPPSRTTGQTRIEEKNTSRRVRSTKLEYAYASFDLQISVGKQTKTYRTTASGSVSVDLVADFGLSMFDQFQMVNLDIWASEPRIMHTVALDIRDWTVPYFRVERRNASLRTTRNKQVYAPQVGEEFPVLSTNDGILSVLHGGDRCEVSESSGRVFWSVRERLDPKRPPNLDVAAMRFEETSGDGYLDAEETGKITLNILNKGKGPAYRIAAKVGGIASQTSDIVYPASVSVGSLQAGETKAIEIPISASLMVKSERRRLRIEIAEANGFDADPKEIAFETRAFRPPELFLADQGIDDANGNGTIELGEAVDVTARVQNRGRGDAQDVTATANVEGEGQNIFYQADNKQFALGTLRPGEFRDIRFTILTNRRFAGDRLPVSVAVREKRGTYGGNFPLALPLSKQIKRTEELVVRGKETTLTSIPDVASLTVDVDVDIPKTLIENSDAVAVVIGISHYQNRDVSMVDYARRDATKMKEYLVSALGFNERRIIEIYDQEATLGTFKRTFEEQLPNWVKSGKSDVFIYYSGHGAPDPESREAFFVPYDCNPSYAKSTGYKVKEFYNRLSMLKARTITVVVDACFSGASEKGMLLKSVSPIFISIDNPVASIPAGVVFTSSTGQQVSTWYHEKKHGLFTYYFLKGLRGDADGNGDKEVTVQELASYVQSNVPDQARYLSNREQTPQVMGGDRGRVLVKY